MLPDYGYLGRAEVGGKIILVRYAPVSRGLAPGLPVAYVGVGFSVNTQGAASIGMFFNLARQNDAPLLQVAVIAPGFFQQRKIQLGG